jgi:hypothetical protein
MSRDKPLISPESAGYLARVVNRVAASFDVAALSAEEAVELYTLLDRLTGIIWSEHKQVLFPLYQSMLQRRGLLEDDEPEDEPEGSGGYRH